MLNFKEWLITEEIWQNKTATVYHRTDVESIPKILSTTFKSATGCAYGCGLYTTISIINQFRGYMARYGPALIKFKISNLDEYVICQKNIAQRVLGNNYLISDQLKRLKLTDLYTEDQIKDFDKYFVDGLADRVASYMYEANRNLEKRAKGIITQNNDDGYVLLKYNPVEDSTIKILAYTTNAPVENTKIMDNLAQNIGWTKTYGKASVKSAFDTPEKDREKLYSQVSSNLQKEYLKLQNDQSQRKFLILVSKRLPTLTDEEKRLFFNEAISKKLLNIVQKFYEVEPQLYQGFSPLETSVKANDLEITKYLISKGLQIQPNLAIEAIKNQNLEMLKLLVDNGANINEYTLRAAAEANIDRITNYLLDKGLKPDLGVLDQIVTNKNYGMFYYAVNQLEKDEIPEYAIANFAKKGNIPAVKYLVQKGAKVMNAAEMAFRDNNEQMLWAIIGKNNKDQVVQYACGKNDIEFLKYLLKFGIKPTARCGILAFGYGSRTTDEYIEFLKQNDVSNMILNDPEFQNKPDGSSISAAVQLSNNKMETVKIILNQKNLPDSVFQSIYYALKNEPDNIKKPILDYVSSVAQQQSSQSKAS